MRYNQLGRTGLRVSALGFGAAPLGDEYGLLDPREADRAVRAAIDAGINLFDVSPYYGRTLAEERLGRSLEGVRDRVLLSTKVGRYDRHPPHGFDFSARRVVTSIEESLTRLRTDVIDIFLAHDIEFAPLDQVLTETLPAMRRLREEGKVRHIGVSAFPLEILRDAIEATELDVVLSYCHYDLLNTRLDTELAPVAADRSVGLISASPLHMGVLTPDPPPPWHPAPPEVLDAGRRAAAWCAERGLNIAEIALRFAVDNPRVASTLVGIRTVREVESNLRALSPDPLPGTTVALREMLAPVQGREWPSGLPQNNPGGGE